MFKTIINSVFSSLGYVVSRKRPEPPDTEVRRFIRQVTPNTMVGDAGLESLYSQALHCEAQGIAGAYVECGVWKGGSMGMMALVNRNHGKLPRHLHLFDSFSEICEPDEKLDGKRALREVKMWSKGGQAQGRLIPLKGIYDHLGGAGTVGECRRLLELQIGFDPDRVHYHEGWFQDTLPRSAATIGPIAILRLDSDWYASTKVCLDHLFEQVVPGGFVIIDDYGTYDGCRKAVDEFLAARGLSTYLHPVNDDIRYFIAR